MNGTNNAARHLLFLHAQQQNSLSEGGVVEAISLSVVLPLVAEINSVRIIVQFFVEVHHDFRFYRKFLWSGPRHVRREAATSTMTAICITLNTSTAINVVISSPSASPSTPNYTTACGARRLLLLAQIKADERSSHRQTRSFAKIFGGRENAVKKNNANRSRPHRNPIQSACLPQQCACNRLLGR